MLHVENLTVAFETGSGFRLVNDRVSFSLKSGEWLGIMGPSGSGKTVMVRAVAGLIHNSPGIIDGSILFHEENLLAGLSEVTIVQRVHETIVACRKKDREWMKILRNNLTRHAKNGFAYIAQVPRESLNPYFTVERHLREALAAGGITDNGVMIRAKEILSQLKFHSPDDIVRKYPHELSGGMAQRVAVAMALAQKAEIIIADECTTSLDPETGASVIESLQRARDTFGCSVIFTTHESALANAFCDRVVTIEHGKILRDQRT